MIVKLRDELKGKHVHSRIFMGVDEDHLQLCGTLVMDIGAWQIFGAALLLGADHMARVRMEQGTTHRDLTILLPDSKSMEEALKEKNG
jgi:hypothetical protein